MRDEHEPHDWTVVLRPALAIIPVIALLGGLALWASLSSRDADAPLHRLVGSVLISDPTHFIIAGQRCQGTGPFARYALGATVVVSRENGEVLSTASLEQGRVTAEHTCRLQYGIDVPEVSRYRFAVAGVDQGTHLITTLEASSLRVDTPGSDWSITHRVDEPRAST